MTEMRFMEHSCDRVVEKMDLYLDNELSGSEREVVQDHIRDCPCCEREVHARSTLRGRLRIAVNAEPVSLGFENRIRQALDSGTRRRRPFFSFRLAMPVAAVFAIALGVTIAYQLGHLRFTAASQESYIGSISERVPVLLRVGLGDHVHCSVFRKFPKNPPTFAQMTEKLGPEYKDLLPVVSENVTGDYRVVLGHRCSYHRRKFVHISLTDGSRLISLVIAKRGDGESFDKSDLPAMLADGIPLYRASVQRFNIAAFETEGHLVYVVSDMGRDDNSKLLAAMSPKIRAVLQKLEQSA